MHRYNPLSTMCFKKCELLVVVNRNTFLAYPTGISVNTRARKCRLTRGCKTTLVHDVKMTILKV